MTKEHIKFKNDIENELSNKTEKKIYTSQHSTSYIRNNDSLNNFKKSIKTNWKNHIKSYDKYQGKKHISCFLMTSDDWLTVTENMTDKKELGYGDLARRGRINFCLAYDTELLNFMYGYKTRIDYVMYYNLCFNTIECIKTSNIPDIIAYLNNHNYYVYALSGIKSSDTFGIHIPIIK